MTFADFRTGVRERTESAGGVTIETHPTPESGLDAHLSNSLKQFCAWTFCLRGLVTATLANGASTLAVGALSPRVIHPLQLAVAGVILTNYAGLQGPCRIEDLRANAVGAGNPDRWAWSTDEVIQFNKAPTADRTVIFYGFIEHPTVSGDSDVILLPSEWQEAALDYAAVRLVQPVAIGANVEKLEFLNTGLRQDVLRLCHKIEMDFPSLSIPFVRQMEAEARADAS